MGGRKFLPLMPSPASFVTANLGDAQAVVEGLSEFERLKSNPSDFVIAQLSNGKKFVGFGERMFDDRRGSLIFLRVNVKLNKFAGMLVGVDDIFVGNGKLVSAAGTKFNLVRNDGIAVRAQTGLALFLLGEIGFKRPVVIFVR